MGLLEITEIVLTGVKYLENWLNENGYTAIESNAWQKGSADILADSPGKNIFVQVRTTQQPAEQVIANETDKFAIKDFAERAGRLPYIAYLVIDDNKNLVGEIAWERLG